jgi:beta-lactam-binding protein with PASTA domain
MGAVAAFDAAVDALAAPSLPGHVHVPDFRGMSMNEVWAVALKAGVKVEVTRLPDDAPEIVGHEPPPEGRVASQSVPPGTRVERDAEVEVRVQFPSV